MLIWIIKFGLIWRCNFCFWRSKYVIIADMSCCEKWSLHLPLIIFINTVVKISCQVWFAKLCLGSFAIINPNIVNLQTKRIYYLSNTIWILENYNIGIWVSKLRQQSDNFDFFVCFPFDNIYSMTLTSFKPFLLRIVTYGL